ncbi:MAG TPA: YdeI/OmpD-associated family protein, partial [Steroidobacteraceae bacterium]
MATFFEAADDFAAWLEQHGAGAKDLTVGFHKKGSRRASMSWSESVDAALCFGWIDGVRKRIDEHSYQIRFSPRMPHSIWSAINIAKVRVLKRQGRMQASGLAAFANRREERSKIYSYEQQKRARLAPGHEARLRKSQAVWKFFEAQPQSYRQLVVWRIVSAKRPATQESRLAALIKACREQRRL